MKIVLDPNIIWFDSNNVDDFEYLSEVVQFIDQYIELQYFASQSFLLRLHNLSKDPLKGYRESEERKDSIIRKIWQSLDTNEFPDLSQYTPTSIPESYQLPAREDLREYITEIFGYAESGEIDFLLFLAVRNHQCNAKTHGSITFVKHIYKELDSYLAKIFSEGKCIKCGNVVSPSYENPLPNSGLCKAYSAIRVELISAGMGNISNFKKIGREVALRNGYAFDSYLTKINNEAIREIFTSKQRPIIHISTDIEHGAFEAFNERGKHLGEFSYEGRMTQKPSKDHIIKIKR